MYLLSTILIISVAVLAYCMVSVIRSIDAIKEDIHINKHLVAAYSKDVEENNKRVNDITNADKQTRGVLDLMSKQVADMYKVYEYNKKRAAMRKSKKAQNDTDPKN